MGQKVQMASLLKINEVWNRKLFSSLEEKNSYLKAQVEYLKGRHPNLHGKKDPKS